MIKIVKVILLIPFFIGFTSSPVLSDEQAMTVSLKRLKMETALKIAQAAIQQCRKEGVQIAVTVVDRGGHPQVVLRDVAFTTPLSQMEGRFTKPFQVAKMDGLIVSAGGIPVNIGGNLMAGIGVSGAPSGEIDEKCAKAGLDAVSADLEMEGM